MQDHSDDSPLHLNVVEAAAEAANSIAADLRAHGQSIASDPSDYNLTAGELEDKIVSALRKYRVAVETCTDSTRFRALGVTDEDEARWRLMELEDDLAQPDPDPEDLPDVLIVTAMWQFDVFDVPAVIAAEATPGDSWDQPPADPLEEEKRLVASVERLFERDLAWPPSDDLHEARGLGLLDHGLDVVHIGRPGFLTPDI